MAKVGYDIIEIMKNIDAPWVVGEIDRALAENQQQREELQNLRSMAVRRHGENSEERPPNNLDEQHKSRTQGSDIKLPSQSMTLAGLVEHYKTDPDSKFATLSHSTREVYESHLKLILRDYGEERLSNLNARVFLQWHAIWKEGGADTVAHAKIGQLRRLFSYGATMLEDADCTRLSLVLSKLKFEVPPARTEKMTTAQADAIRAMAHEKGRPSIALAQAFQLDIRLRQKDVIGDWVPVGDRGESDTFDDSSNKWVRGLRWEDIDDNLVLRKQTTYGDIAFDLRMAPTVMDELSKKYPSWDMKTRDALPKTGPIIVSEYSKLPWPAVEYRRWWRIVADAAGIPPELRSADTRKAS